MRKIILVAAIAAICFPAAAQQKPAAKDVNTPAVNTPNTPPNPAAPVAGANSFTEAQVKSRLEAAGYTNVTELRKDEQGIWRGKAMKDGRQVNVGVDFKGTIAIT